MLILKFYRTYCPQIRKTKQNNFYLLTGIVRSKGPLPFYKNKNFVQNYKKYGIEIPIILIKNKIYYGKYYLEYNTKK